MPSTVPTQQVEDLSAAVARVRALSRDVIDQGLAGTVENEDIAECLYAAARLYSAKRDRVGKQEWPIGSDALTATETVVLVSALLEAADVNIFDMAIWYRRSE